MLISRLVSFLSTRAKDQLLVQLIRSSLYFILFVLSFAGIAASSHFMSSDLEEGMRPVALMGLAFSVLGLFLPRGLWSRFIIASILFGIDLMLLTYVGIQGFLGVSQVFLLLTLIVAAGGLTFGKRGGALVALGASLISSMALIVGPELRTVQILTQLILGHFGFFVVAFVSGYFSDALKDQDQQIGNLKAVNDLILETVPTGILLIDGEGNVLQTNPSSLRMLPWLKEMNSRPLNLLNHFPQLRPLGQRIEEEILDRTQAEVRSYRLQIVPLRIDGIQSYVVALEDLTEFRRLEFSRNQAEKLAAVGQLAAGIAHEIRNPLTGISGSVEMMSHNVQTEDDRKLSKIILKEIDRLNRLITEFLDFAKPEKPPVDEVDLGRLLTEMVDSMKLDSSSAKAGDPIQWIIHVEGFVRLLAHGDKLKQAFLNILVNAGQAVQGVSSPRVEVRVSSQNGTAEVRIRDNGVGIKAEMIGRIFEPFLTTKPKGTGLGLAITHKIIEAHRGQIFVESSEQTGTQFLIRFPELQSESHKMV